MHIYSSYERFPPPQTNQHTWLRMIEAETYCLILIISKQHELKISALAKITTFCNS